MVLSVYVFKLFNDVSRSSGLFRNLANLTRNFSGELEIETIVSMVTDTLPKWFNEASCLIFVQRDGQLVPLSGSDESADETTTALLAYVERNLSSFEQPHLARRLSDEPEFANLSYHGLLVAPFQSSQSERGFCCLLARRFNEFDARTLDAVAILANQLTVSFRNAMRYESVEKQSLYDELTKLPNHRFCERRLSEEIMRFECNGSLSLLLIDLDHFKKVNDTYGHLAGNVVLHAVARTFEKSIRKSDFVARYGGEEFLVVLPGATTDLAYTIAEKIRTNVEALDVTVPTMDGEMMTVSVTVSIGVATFPDHAKDPQQLVRYADRAMYHGAKRAGRNRVAVYQKDSREIEQHV
jgi:diguanylate cyclase (GGDEF)-like protein